MVCKFLTFLLLLLPSFTSSLSRDEVITLYFRCGYSYKLILCFLFALHGIYLSLRQLKRILRRLGLRRRHPINFHIIDQSMRAIQVILMAYFSCCFLYTLHTYRLNCMVQEAFLAIGPCAIDFNNNMGFQLLGNFKFFSS